MGATPAISEIQFDELHQRQLQKLREEEREMLKTTKIPAEFDKLDNAKNRQRYLQGGFQSQIDSNVKANTSPANASTYLQARDVIVAQVRAVLVAARQGFLASADTRQRAFR